MAECESGEASLRGEAEDRAENGARRKEIAGVRAGPRLVYLFFARQVRQETGKSGTFAKKETQEEAEVGGWGAGRGGSATEKKTDPRQVRSYSARNDTSPPVAVPSARGGRRVRLAPANTGGDGYVSRYYNRHGGGAGGWERGAIAPFFARNTTTTTLMARPPPVLSTPTGEASAAEARHFQKLPFALRDLFCCSRPAVSCYTSICTRRIRPEEEGNSNSGLNANVSSLFSAPSCTYLCFFMTKVRILMIVFPTVCSLCSTNFKQTNLFLFVFACVSIYF